MPPVYLIHWGNPEKEPNELSNIQQCWEYKSIKINHHCIKVERPSGDAIHKALKTAIEDKESQVIYLTCHGSLSGFLYSKIGPEVSYRTVGNWLKEMSVENCEKALVFGSCVAMSEAVSIEQYMPEWITRVAGFKGEPWSYEAADLAAGIILDLWRFGGHVFGAYAEALKAAKKKGAATQIAASMAAIKKAAQEFSPNPKELLAVEIRDSAIMASRDPKTQKWCRS